MGLSSGWVHPIAPPRLGLSLPRGPGVVRPAGSPEVGEAMTVNAVRRPRRVAKVREDAPLPIGEVDVNIVECPVCKRPKDASARRCAGCRTRFVLGVQASKASVLVAFGVAAGLLVGGGVVAVAAPRTVVQAPAVPNPTVAPAATTGSVPTAAATSDPVPTAPIGVPAAATAALRGTATVNARIAEAAAPLAAQLTAPNLDANEVARVLRRLSFEAGAADALLPSLTAWPEASTVQAELGSFYADVRSVASQTLASSVRNEDAYREGARQLLEVLARLPGIDAASRALAGSVDLVLPPVVAS